MTSRQLDEEAIFHIARDLTDAAKRATYLDQVCAGDQALRERVEGLLGVHEHEQSFLKSNGAVDPTVDQSPITEAPGQEIGRYKLLQIIGEGGFGVVYMAEQSRPVRRKVALKIIKPGMDTHAVIARFEAERQALAMMDHTNIARVLDGGTTDSGRPYFVMELVKGVPITEYSDKNQLPTDERLKLFMTVCQSVQHAHQKGIIHRDLKPSNILVTLADGRPIVKVIDFGVAKATNQQLTEKTLFTAYGQMVGTPQYMSPEQAEMSCLDVDTRSDVYSLGVLLYELLTGTTPLEAERLRTAGFAEMQRIIREEEPPKPSTRVSTSGDKVTAIAKYRSVTPEKLKNQIEGDLDWIVMKALDKDRNRRYDSASRLAEDVERFLNSQLVEARPPSIGYRLKKFYERNRALTLSAAVVFLLLSFTLVAIAFQNHRLKAAREEAIRQAKIADDRSEQLRKATTELEARNVSLQRAFVDRAILDAMGGNFGRADLSISQAEDAGADLTLLSAIRGLARYFSGDVESAIQDLRQTTRQNPESIEAWSVLSLATYDAGEYGYMSECRQHLLSLEPRTDIERMLRAMTNVMAEPSQALDEFKELVAGQENLAVLRVLRAVALNETAKFHKNAELLQESLSEFEWASELMPENRFVQSNYLEAIVSTLQLAALEKTADHSQTVDIPELKTRAEKIIDSLEGNPNAERFSRIARAAYFATIGDTEDYQRVSQNATPGETAQVQLRAAELFTKRDYVELKRFLDQQRKPSTATMSAYSEIDLASSDDERSRIAQKAFDAMTASRKYAISNSVLGLEVFLLAGDLDALVKNAKRLLQKPASLEWRWFERTLEFLSNPTTARLEKYINDAEPFSNQCSYAYHVAGLVSMARGERGTAERYFRRAIDAGRFDWWSHVWSKAFLSRMEQDRNWPNWISKKDSNAKLDREK